jgi:hypothetical protein
MSKIPGTAEVIGMSNHCRNFLGNMYFIRSITDHNRYMYMADERERSSSYDFTEGYEHAAVFIESAARWMMDEFNLWDLYEMVPVTSILRHDGSCN